MRFARAGRPFACVAVLLIGGWIAPAPVMSHFAEPRYYAHDLFATREECAASRLYTCEQTIIFCPNRSAQYSVSDIIHYSRYDLRDDLVTVRPRANEEVPGIVRFTLSADGESLKHGETGTVWTRRPKMDDLARSACQRMQVM
ncbi:MAG TPA: hypothetical protein VFT45_09665 [Longimicrobium sp.]|nr:hypothetical protein [Longimicrobium sp.]